MYEMSMRVKQLQNSRRTARASTKQTALVASAKVQTRSRLARSTLSRQKKQSLTWAIQQPMMAAPHYDLEEHNTDKCSVTPILQELTRIKERVSEVCK